MTPDDPGSQPPQPSREPHLPDGLDPPGGPDSPGAPPVRDPEVTSTYRTSRSASRSRPPGRRPPEPTHRGWIIVGVVALLAVAGFLIWYFVFRSDEGGDGSTDVALSSETVDFGDQDLGQRSAPQEVTLTNSGSEPIGIGQIGIQGKNKQDFSVGNKATTCTTEAPLNADESCTIAVRFKPKGRGERTAQVVVSFNQGVAPISSDLVGSGVGNPAVVVETSRLDYGNVNLGKTEVQKMSVTNAGNAPLVFEGFAVQGENADAYTITNKTTCSTDKNLKAGAACTISVRFEPTATGQQNASLVIRHDAEGSPANVQLRGTGVGQPKVQLPSEPVDFGQVDVDSQSDPQTVTLRNTGTGPLALQAIGIGGNDQSDFTIASGGSCSTENRVAPGDSCTIAVVFQPSTAGTRSALLTIATNAKQAVHQVQLAGTGTGGQTVTTE